MNSKENTSAIIEVKKNYSRIILNYLQSKNLTFKMFQTDDQPNTKFEIHNITPADAFRLGVFSQVQLRDGEFLI